MTHDPIRNLLAITFIGLLGAASLWVLSPFLRPLAWSSILVIVTWPQMRRLQAWLGDRRGLAVMIMVVLQSLVLIIPIMLAVGTMVKYAADIAALPEYLSKFELHPPPAWLLSVPLAGPKLAAKWQELSSAGAGAIAEQLKPYASQLARWFLSQMGNVGLRVVNFLLVLIISAVLYYTGEKAASGVRQFAWRLAGDRGVDTVKLATQTIRAVALGIVVTALIQSIIGGIGLAIAGVPYPGALTALMFVLGVVQIGAGPVMLLSSGWLFWHGETGWGIALFAWSIIVMSIDNVVRPLLIRRGADLPLMLIFAGVIGGLFALGIIGLFLGPMVLAVAYTLIVAWVQEGNRTLPNESENSTSGD